MNSVKIILSITFISFICQNSGAQPIQTQRVVIENQGWELVGDLVIPTAEKKVPVVLMLNKANGNREEYKELADHLANRGIASLRLDLRGHGESINIEEFIPGKNRPDPLIWDAEVDVIAATEYLKKIDSLDPERIGLIGGSYSGEEMAEAGRINGYEKAYVELSPGSFSDESIDGIDESGVSWLFIVSRDERYLKEIQALVQEKSETVELIVIPGSEHATRLLNSQPSLAERIAIWLSYEL